MMMVFLGVFGLGLGESVGGRGFRWIDLFGSSFFGNFEVSFN